MQDLDVGEDLCVSLPPEYSSLGSYRATLGHKVNHADEGEVRRRAKSINVKFESKDAMLQNNARFSVYTAHPVLGTVMAVVATRSISRGEEVLANYGYSDQFPYDVQGIRNQKLDPCSGAG